MPTLETIRNYKLLHRLGSLKLTAVILVASMLLVFFGTLDQVRVGINLAQNHYFERFLTFYPYRAEGYGLHPSQLGLPLPGGFLVGGLLVINLVCAHFRLYGFSLKKSIKKWPIALTHGGVVLLIVAGFLSASMQQERQMRIAEGETINFAYDPLHYEVVLADTTHAQHNNEVRIPFKLIKNSVYKESENSAENGGAALQHPALPFEVRTLRAFGNTLIFRSGAPKEAFKSQATRGVAKTDSELTIFAMPKNYSPDATNTPAAEVELFAEGESIGSWLLSPVLIDAAPPQTFTHAGRTYTIMLRSAREDFPFAMTLTEFTHEYYPGTDIPKNFQSTLQLTNETDGTDRQVLVYMNHPLRYQGWTFYQFQFQKGQNFEATVLQVVKNPSAFLPYLALIMLTIGMLSQFTGHLIKYVRKQMA